ncbi:hypothetical protein GCM10022278_40520 [Allohahella marinimesophila]|uniref:Uncharacterized protein n=1 Tax=Allohahella marinimesophila TaxID=1054972 RepID=A0ABP7QEU7_9GAMM
MALGALQWHHLPIIKVMVASIDARSMFKAIERGIVMAVEVKGVMKPFVQQSGPVWSIPGTYIPPVRQEF